jgi:hypothetical protein
MDEESSLSLEGECGDENAMEDKIVDDGRS